MNIQKRIQRRKKINSRGNATTIAANTIHVRGRFYRVAGRFPPLSPGRTYRALSVARIYNVSRQTLGVPGAKRSRGLRYNSFVWAAAKVVRLRRPRSVYAEKRISPGRRCQTSRGGLHSLTHVRGRSLASIIPNDRRSVSGWKPLWERQRTAPSRHSSDASSSFNLFPWRIRINSHRLGLPRIPIAAFDIYPLFLFPQLWESLDTVNPLSCITIFGTDLHSIDYDFIVIHVESRNTNVLILSLYTVKNKKKYSRKDYWEIKYWY